MDNILDWIKVISQQPWNIDAPDIPLLYPVPQGTWYKDDSTGIPGGHLSGQNLERKYAHFYFIAGVGRQSF